MGTRYRTWIRTLCETRALGRPEEFTAGILVENIRPRHIDFNGETGSCAYDCSHLPVPENAFNDCIGTRQVVFVAPDRQVIQSTHIGRMPDVEQVVTLVILVIKRIPNCASFVGPGGIPKALGVGILGSESESAVRSSDQLGL